jgi:hypothetical protein
MGDQKPKTAGDLLERFANAESLDARLSALAELIKNRGLHGAREDERLGSGMDYLGRLAADPQGREQRLRAVGALARIGTVKSLAKRTEALLAQALQHPLPALAALKDPYDRYYVANALRRSRQDWIVDYVAVGAVQERQAEKSRQELVGVLFERSDTLAQVFSRLASGLKAFVPETKNPGDSVAKRVERILAAIRPQAVSVLIDPGTDAGQCAQDMLRAAFTGARSPETPEVALKTIEEIGGLLHDIARTQIALVAEPSLYAALDLPRGWVSAPEWRYIAEKSLSFQLLTRDIREALTLLAKQGKTDDALFEQLIKASGSREAAAKIATSIAERHPDIDHETREWLTGGSRSRRRPQREALEESRELSADPILANLMIDGHNLREALAGISDDTTTELRVLEPALAEPLDLLLVRCRAMLSGLDALATKRGLNLHGRSGELVEYSQSVHELIGGHVQGVRQVEVVQPLVVRESAAGGSAVIRKALVKNR